MSDLKRCLHCGGEAQMQLCNGRGQPEIARLATHYRVVCLKCGISTKAYQTKKGAFNAWNRSAERRGKWTADKDGAYMHWRCSECNAPIWGAVYTMNFCPNCGARMSTEPPEKWKELATMGDGWQRI